jgi:hypothetical protein
MLEPAKLRPDDRVLLLGDPGPAAVESIAARLARGLLVIMCDEEQVRRGRRDYLQFDNVMLIPLDGSTLPWESGFFTAVHDLAGDRPDRAAIEREMARVKKAIP